MRTMLLLALLAGCGSRQVFVRTIKFEDRHLVVEKCPLGYYGRSVTRDDAACVTETIELAPAKRAAR